MTHRMKFGAYLAGVALASAVSTGSVAAEDNTTSQSSNIFWHASQPMSGNTGGASFLVRGDKEVWLEGYAKGLNPMNAYTVWAVIFNNPQHCVDGCGPDDLGTPSVKASLIWAGGFIADSGDGTDGSAQAHFEAHLIKKNPLGEVLGIPGTQPKGLLKAKKAEIHFIIRCHGVALPDFAASQISTLNGGCAGGDPPGPNACEDVQVGIHLP